jgi:hypothetical protein
MYCIRVGPKVHPANAVTNQMLRMRVSEELSSYYTPGFLITDACYNPEYGQVEDYPVMILSSILPVNWDYFKGVRRTNSIQLVWKPLAETNASHFKIERSYDGTHFTSIRTVPATGLSTGSVYAYDDKTYSGLVVYYRLKQVDKHGQSAYTHTITIKNGTDNNIYILRNPFRTHLELDISTSSPSKLVIHLLDATGKLVHHQTTTVSVKNVYRVTPGN